MTNQGGGAHNISLGGNPHPVPQFKDKNAERQWILEHMAGAFRVFGAKGYTEGSAGHISVRDPVKPDTFWINPLGVHYSMLKASDMVHVDEEGQVIGGSGRPINAAGFKIHSAIHKARPDVHAACHAHSIHGKAWSTFGKPVEMLNQDSCVFYNAHGVYDDFGGVVLNDEEGHHIASALGDTNKALILRNHGLLTVGTYVDEAAYLFTLLERTCQAQLLADAAAANGIQKQLVSNQAAQYTFDNTSDPESLYLEFQPDYEYELFKDPNLKW